MNEQPRSPILSHKMRALVLSAIFWLAPASAQLYICKDGDQTRYTSVPTANGHCRLLPSYEKKTQSIKQIDELQLIQPPKTSKPTASPRSVISPKTQKQRDNKRGKVLLYELTQEQQRKDIWLQELSKAAPDNEQRLSLLQEQIRIHELNIVAIEQELARLNIYVGNTGN